MSFRLKTILGVALIEAVLLMVLVFSSLNFLSQSNQQEIDKRAKSTVKMFASTVKDAVLSTDMASLHAFVDELLTHPGIEYVRIKDQRNTLVQGGKLDEYDNKPIADSSVADVDDAIYDISAPIIEGDYTFGFVELGLSIDELNVLLGKAKGRFILIASVEMLLVAFFSFLLGKYLTRTLDQLRDASVAIVEGGPGIEIPVSGNDELAITGRAFNAMSRRLSANYDKLHETLEASRNISILLQESNLRMKSILNHAIDGIVLINDQGIIEEINPVGCHLFGYTQKGLLGKNIHELIPEAYHNTQENPGNTFETNRTITTGRGREVIGLRHDKSTFPIDLSVSEISFGEQRLFVGLVRDLSERKKIEAEVDTTRAINSATIAASLDGLISIDMDGRVLEFSQAAETIFGYSRDEILGNMLEDYILPESMRARHRHGLEHYRKTGKGPVIGKRIEVNGLRNDGTEVPVEMAVVPISVGTRTLFTAFVRDISERLKSEEQLKQAKILAEQSSEAKSRFLATMSHEIRSPLNAVLGSIDLLLDTPLDREQAVYIHTAKDSGHALLSLINDILDFSKIEAGELVLEQDDFDPAELVDSVFHIMTPKAENKDIDLVSCIYSNVPAMVHGDAARLRQILLNLTDNALKFSEYGAVSIRLGARSLGVDGVELTFEVQDDGTGIPPDMKDKLFEEFSQIDASHSTKYGGTGLGLAISLRLARLMSGNLEVESEEGKGSCFLLKVRVGSSENACQPMYTIPENNRILLVHPKERVRDLLVAQYRQKRLVAEAAATIEEALEMGRTGELFTTLLIDERLLRTISVGHMQSLRRNILHNEGTLAAMTFMVSGDIDSALRDLGFDQLIKKPLTRSVMFGMIGTKITTPDSTDGSPKHTDISTASDANKSYRLLLAEDSPANQLIASAILRKAGYEVDLANNGTEAIDAIIGGGHDLILMDMRMPGMNGLEATRAIRALPGPEARLPIIALTANALKEDVEQCMESGMDDFISKPVSKQRLLAVVSQWTSQAAGEISDMNSTTSNSVDMLDENILKSLAEDTSAEMVPVMLQAFITETRDRLERIDAMGDKASLAQLEDEAHAMKSGAGTFGAPRLHILAKDLETACRNNDAEGAADILESLLPLAEQTLAVIEKRCAELESALEPA
jgi:PAS domain S-box-containing protein